MAKKARKVLKQESQRRAIQQSVANVNTVSTVAPAPAEATGTVAPVRSVVKGVSEEQEFAYVKSDVRRTLALAGLFSAGMIVLSFFIR